MRERVLADSRRGRCRLVAFVAPLLVFVAVACSTDPAATTLTDARAPTAVASAATQSHTPTTSPTLRAASPSPTATATPPLPSALQQPIVSEVGTRIPAYARDDWQHWIDADHDCQNTRAEVLIDESAAPVTFTSASNGCTVATGLWVGPFTGQSFTLASDVDVDHMVPLKNAHDSGGWAWSASRKRDYANDLANSQHLVAVDDGTNQSKGARGPDQWKPPLRTYWCQYAADWISIKNRWSLSVSPAEWAALQLMLDTCDGGSPRIVAATPTLTPIPGPTRTARTAGLPIGTRTGEAVIYDPLGPDRDCGDFSTWEQAQDFYEAAGADNAHGLDSNRDGVACQSLPGAP